MIYIGTHPPPPGLARNLWALVICLGLAAFLPACPIRIDIPTAEVCPSRPNCGRCAATAPCAWCPSTDPALRGCIGSDMVDECDTAAVTVVERCPEDEMGYLPR